MNPEEIAEQAVDAGMQMYHEGQQQAALDYFLKALEADPECYEALVAAGEQYLYKHEELNLSEQEGDLLALEYFDRAIAARSDLAEAYVEKARTLLYLDEPEPALKCVEQGFPLLGPMPSDGTEKIWTNIAESFYRVNALALKECGRTEEGKRILEEGLQRFPNSEYLTLTVDYFLPDAE